MDNVLVLEREAFEIFVTEMKDSYIIEKSVLLNLKDYHHAKTMDLLKIKTP